MLVAVLGVAAVAAVVITAVTVRLSAEMRATAATADEARARAIAHAGIETVIGLLLTPESGIETPRATSRIDGASLGAEATGRLASAASDVLDGGPVPDVRIEVAAAGPGDPFVVTSIAEGTARSVRVEARLRRLLSVDYAWFTHVDVLDPELTRASRRDCAEPLRHAPRPASCVRIPLRGLVIDGPLHVNDALLLVDTDVLSVVSTAHHDAPPGDPTVSTLVPGLPAPGAGPFRVGAGAPLGLPDEPSQGLGGDAPTCRLIGPTLLRFDGYAVRIRSPLTAAAALDGTSGQASAPLGCAGIDLTLLTEPTSVTLPERAVIEILPAVDVPCGVHPLGLEATDDGDRDWPCWSGDALVWGRYRGQRTVLAAGDIQLVWDVEPGDREGADEVSTSTALLGLVAGDSVILRRLVGPPLRRIAPLGLNLAVAGPDIGPFGAYPLDAPVEAPTVWHEPRIVAALVALGGSVSVQNPMIGTEHQGPVTVHGSIVQRFRGILGWDPADTGAGYGGRTGYRLALTYDRRLREEAPPAMPSVGHPAVRVIAVEEVRP